jgi:integrase
MKTWKEALKEYYRFKKMGKNDFSYRKYFDPLLENKDLNSLTRADIAAIRSGIKGKSGTVNRYLSFFRAILNFAYEELGWLDTKPFVKSVDNCPKKSHYFSQEDIEKLYVHLPEHLKKPFIFSLLTGVRMSNCLNLRWKQIVEDQVAIEGTETKNGKVLCVPLNKKCKDLLSSIDRKGPYVFTYAGRKITRASNTGWYKALDKAGLKGMRWHDLRHTWASHHVQNGTPLHTLQILGGWSDFNIVTRYAHLSKDYLNDACEVSNSLVS